MGTIPKSNSQNVEIEAVLRNWSDSPH
jgi:hypothetical protein